LTAALDANRVSGVVVTSADEDVLRYICDSFGSKVLAVKRDSQLARLNSPIEDAVKHALQKCSEDRWAAWDVLVVLGIESPFRRSEHVDTAINLLEVFDTDCVIGVLPETDAFYRHTGNGLQPLRSSDVLRLESEELYRRAGQLFVLRRDLFESRGCLVGGRIGHLVMDRLSAMRLRSEWDWGEAHYRAGKMLECKSDFEPADGPYPTQPYHDPACVSYRPTHRQPNLAKGPRGYPMEDTAVGG
jgi:CMP-N-acetylneuraminic acid synthetase